VTDLAAVQKHLDRKAITYDKETPQSNHITALQMGCFAQSLLAQHSVNGVIAKILPEQWSAGVYVLFEAAVSRVFFETFATTLHGKAGGLNVLVNASQRMLAVQLLDKNKRNDEKKNETKKGHILVKVGTDGRFAITTTPVQNNNNNNNNNSTPATANATNSTTPNSTTATTATSLNSTSSAAASAHPNTSAPQ
jgi:hypothetical protein